MRCSALFTVIVVGTSMLASAQPRPPEPSERISYGEAKDTPKQAAPHQPGEWIELATPTPAKHGTEIIMVGKDTGYFSQVRLHAAKGSTIVQRVRVIFADGGKARTVKLDKRLDAKHPELVIQLGSPRAIDRVVVTTATNTRGEYALYGSSAEGGTAAASR